MLGGGGAQVRGVGWPHKETLSCLLLPQQGVCKARRLVRLSAPVCTARWLLTSGRSACCVTDCNGSFLCSAVLAAGCRLVGWGVLRPFARATGRRRREGGRMAGHCVESNTSTRQDAGVLSEWLRIWSVAANAQALSTPLIATTSIYICARC